MHQMTRTNVDDDGAETWQCRECSRRILIRQWRPLVRQVLDEGEDVPHAGSKAPDGIILGIADSNAEESPPDWWPEDWR